MLGQPTACPLVLMSELSDRYFVRPRSLLAADKVNIYDAINLVIYAKLPLKSVLQGSALVAGFFERDTRGVSSALLTAEQKRQLLIRYQNELEALRYPIAPSQYERLLEDMVEAGETILPMFVHEHHLLVDRNRRAHLFSQLHGELHVGVKNGNLILQVSDSERTQFLASHAWMTTATLATYLEKHGVAPWWAKEENLTTHARLERILLSDTLSLPSNYDGEAYELEQLPSVVFGGMLLKQSSLPRGFSRPVSAERPQNTDAGARTEAPTPSTMELEQQQPTQEPVRVGSLATRDATTPKRPPSSGTAATNEADVAADTEPGRVTTSSTDDESMISKRSIAALIGMSVSTVDNLRSTPEFPKPISYGPKNTLRWKKSDISQWLRWREEQSGR